MKRLFIGSLLILLLVGCGNPMQEELLSYINEDLPPLAEKESEVIARYESVTGDNYTNDEVMYAALVDEVQPKYQSFITDLEAVEIEEKEIKTVHEDFIEAANLQHSAFLTVISAIEEQDREKIDEANQKLSKARKMMRQYQVDLKTLAEDNEIEWEKENK
ncbi:hypothetical protein QUF94_13800 [Peribacillus sp. NJ4]|nr:hypothetical protein [Peribacillus sp. NJ4]